MQPPSLPNDFISCTGHIVSQIDLKDAFGGGKSAVNRIVRHSFYLLDFGALIIPDKSKKKLVENLSFSPNPVPDPTKHDFFHTQYEQISNQETYTKNENMKKSRGMWNFVKI